MARLSICNECEHIVYEDLNGPDYVILDEDDRNLMHASCYEQMVTREDRQLDDVAEKLETVKTEVTDVVAKKRRRMPPDKAA